MPRKARVKMASRHERTRRIIPSRAVKAQALLGQLAFVAAGCGRGDLTCSFCYDDVRTGRRARLDEIRQPRMPILGAPYRERHHLSNPSCMPLLVGDYYPPGSFGL